VVVEQILIRGVAMSGGAEAPVPKSLLWIAGLKACATQNLRDPKPARPETCAT